MRDFFRSVRFKILLAIMMVLFGFMIAALYSGGTAPLLSQVVGLIAEPFQRLSGAVTGGVSGFFEKYFDSARTYKENELLREQNSELRQKLVDYERMKHEYEQLMEIDDMREQNADWAYEIATVIDREYGDPFYSFLIDKGSLDDVALYDPVITAEGLVGRIVQVGLSTSRVMTLLDVNMNIGASNSATRDPGNVTGTVDLAREGLCCMEYLPRESETAPGDIIVTSGGSLFPKGLVIGEIAEMRMSGRGTSMEAVVRPVADVRTVKDVFIITAFEGQGAG